MKTEQAHVAFLFAEKTLKLCAVRLAIKLKNSFTNTEISKISKLRFQQF